ncbi:MAG: substrate-binding domain-containing protein [Gammaproteobacteria bacterium]|nr:substrate-binding domain-containing protein [Gammaproteobacteria bacterium]
MKKLLTAVTALSLLAVMSTSALAAARDYVFIVSSSTVYPFSTVVAEKFGKSSGFKTPKVESHGTGGSLKLFCEGVGVEYADIANASRRIKLSEFEKCRENGVKDIIEVPIGYDGIVIANSKTAKQWNISLKDLYLALAREVPDAAGKKMIPNPNKLWSDVNPSLPKEKIEVIGPPPTSGTRDSFNELAIEGGCKKVPAVKTLIIDKKAWEKSCRTLREDGHYIEAGENDNLIVQKLGANPHALGVFGFSFLDQNADKVQGSIIDGNAPTFESIASGKYPIARPMFFYVKKDHIGRVRGLFEYVEEFISEKAMGEEGYLTERGLVPLPADKYKAVVSSVKAKTKLYSKELK